MKKFFLQNYEDEFEDFGIRMTIGRFFLGNFYHLVIFVDNCNKGNKSLGGSKVLNIL